MVPFLNLIADKPCDLQCVPRNRNDIEMIGSFVTDGTPCRQGLGVRDMCIAGTYIFFFLRRNFFILVKISNKTI